jgi:hypothetical protein
MGGQAIILSPPAPQIKCARPFGLAHLEKVVWEELITAFFENFEPARAAAGKIDDDSLPRIGGLQGFAKLPG